MVKINKTHLNKNLPARPAGGPAGRQAVVLVSGGLDSAVVLYLAKKLNYQCNCLAFDYGQRHNRELLSAKRLAQEAGCPLKIIKIDFPWKGSSLLDKKIKIQTTDHRPQTTESIPATYVPGRNIIFLSFALSFAEAIQAKVIFIGAHTQDYSGYPDCRPQFFQAFRQVIATGTKTGVAGSKIRIHAPLINKTKSQIIRLGTTLNVPFGLTWSCYSGGKRPCGNCDSCYYRQRGFQKAGLIDPARAQLKPRKDLQVK